MTVRQRLARSNICMFLIPLLIAALLLLLVAVLIIVISACSTVTPEDIAEDALDAYMDNDADDYFDLYDEDYLRRYYEYNYNAYLQDCEKQKADSDWDSFVASVKTMGIERCCEIYQGAVARYNAR